MPVRADGRKRKQTRATAHNEKPQVAVTGVNAVRQILHGGTSVNDPFSSARGKVHAAGRSAAGGKSRAQQ